MAIPMLVFKGFAWAKENGQEEEYIRQYEEHFKIKFKGLMPDILKNGYIWAKENGQFDEYLKQHKEYFGVNFHDNMICPVLETPRLQKGREV